MNRDAAARLRRLLHDVDGLAQGELSDRIDEAVAAAEDVLGVDGVGLMFLTPDGTFALAGASNRPAAALELAQQELGYGPGPDATRRGTTVSVPDLRTDTRWPRLAGRVDPHVRAVLAAPVWFDGRPAGNLNALCFAARDWAPEDAQSLAAYAGVITALLRNSLAAGHEETLVTRLRTALRT